MDGKTAQSLSLRIEARIEVRDVGKLDRLTGMLQAVCEEHTAYFLFLEEAKPWERD
jgi:hypothetical protein